jgi:hypothetical protein
VNLRLRMRSLFFFFSLSCPWPLLRGMSRLSCACTRFITGLREFAILQSDHLSTFLVQKQKRRPHCLAQFSAREGEEASKVLVFGAQCNSSQQAATKCGGLPCPFTSSLPQRPPGNSRLLLLVFLVFLRAAIAAIEPWLPRWKWTTS